MGNDIDYMLSVMQAYKEGKTIEHKVRYPCAVWYIDYSPVWNWDYMDYRVKEEENKPLYRPYETKNEFIVDSINNKFYLCDKDTNARFLPTCVLANGVEMTCNGECISLTWKKLFENFTWDNGSPCGTKK